MKSRCMMAGALSLACGRQAWRDWDSVMVGTNARVGTFTEEGYCERVPLLEPGGQTSDLRGATGRFKDIESIWVDCVER
ncbi:hypothetical protein V4F39_01200 [Aquincola sp. MAHUQ-54]|uniref:Secreted protein n=1 Tax=Aquincola agrisoli TaxID=3119538 RepID=A0AAW9PYC5_9BURK